MSIPDRRARRAPRTAALLLALLALAGQARAQADESATLIRPQGPQYGFPDPDDPARFVWVFLGGVEVQRGARLARGDSLVAVLRRGAGAEAPSAPPPGGVLLPDARLLELFLDGNVELLEGDERIHGASGWHLDNATGVSTVVDGQLHAPRAGGLPPLAARFDTLRRLQDGSLHIDGFRYTNCSYGHPHWHVETPWATLTPTPEGRVLETGGNVIRWGDVPFFWLPGFTTNLDGDGGLLLRRVAVGSSSRFGTELLLDWGADASDQATAFTGLFGEPVPVRASWTITTAWYGDRGLFLEPKLKYETASSKGEAFFSSINDSADEDHLDQPISDHSRGRVDLTHRTRLDARRTLDIEVSRQSDANYLQEYHEREFREDKPQETYVSYRDVLDNHALTILGSSRLNDFDGQVEYQPALTDRLVGEPFLGGFATNRAFVSNARRLEGDGSVLDDDHDLRIGDTLRVDWPFDLPGGDRLRVQVGADATWFDRTVDEGSEARSAASAGVEWSRAFHGTDEDARDEDWNIDGLRRLAELRVGYFDRFHVSKRPDELIPIDDIETLDVVRAFTFGWRDRWQTRQAGQVRTLLDLDFLLPVYPQEDRDNGGDTLGPLFTDARWRPGANLVALRDAELRWRSEQDLNDGHFTESFISFTTGLGAGRGLHLSNNKVFHEFDFRTVALTWQLNPRWAVATYHQVDQRVQDRVRSGVVVRQLAHCWYVDLEVGARRGDSASGDDQDETRVSLSLTPAGPADEDLAQRIGGRYY
jgi:hypothetical protein